MRKAFQHLFIYSFMAIAMIGCGGKRSPETKASLKFSVGAVVDGVQMDGGIFMEAVHYDKDNVEIETLLIDLPPDHTVTVPSGSWDMHFVGYTGPSEWTGTNYCGVILAVNLDQPDASLDIVINQANCLSEPYVTLIADKLAANAGGNNLPTSFGPEAFVTSEDAPPLPITVTAGSDLDADPITYSIVSTTSNGTLANCMASDADLLCDYTPNLNFNGTDSFVYRVHDGTAFSAANTTITITVNPINDAPTVTTPQAQSVNENDILNFNLGTAADVDGDAQTYVVVSTTTNGVLSCTGGASTACTYTPNSMFDGVDSFTYKSNDGALDSNIATVNITINNVPATWGNVNWDGTTWE